jgi:uncharacterized protein YaaQ
LFCVQGTADRVKYGPNKDKLEECFLNVDSAMDEKTFLAKFARFLHKSFMFTMCVDMDDLQQKIKAACAARDELVAEAKRVGLSHVSVMSVTVGEPDCGERHRLRVFSA